MRPILAPTLDDDRILRFVSGLRPCRRGGVRIEREDVAGPGASTLVIHNYGQGGCGVTIGWGCAEAAADTLRDALGLAGPSAPPVAVLGGGVVGLTTAHELLARGFPVRVYAQRFGNDTVSNIAGALWLPTGVEFGSTPERVAWFHAILGRSRQRFDGLDARRWGIEELPVYEPAYAPQEERFFNNGTVDPPEQLERLPLPGPPRAGRVYRTAFIHTPRFLRALVDDIRAMGGVFVPRHFDSIDDVRALEEPSVVNCLALGSRTLFGDDAMYPARGVLVHMRPEPLGYIVHDGYKYLFPREDALVLGGCFQPDVWDDAPDEHLCREIIAHHRRFFGLG